MVTVENKRIVKNTVYLYIRSILILIISLYTSRVLLQTLGVDDFGLYNVVAGFTAMFGFLNTSMVNSVQRYMNYAIGINSDEYFDRVFRISLLIQFFLSLLILILLETIGIWFLNTIMEIPFDRIFSANIVFQFTILSFIFKILQVPFTATIVSYEKMDFFAIQGLVEVVMLLMVIYFLKIIPIDSLSAYSCLISIVSLFILLFNILYAKRIYPRLRFRFLYDYNLMKEMFSFSGWNLLGSLSGVLKSQGINILFNMFFSLVVNAARGISYQVLSGVTALIGNFQTAIKPQLIQSYAERNFKRYFSFVFSGSKISYYLMWILVLPIILSINQILTVWLGTGNVPNYTENFTIIILITGLVDSYASVVSLAMYAIGNIRIYQIVVSSIIIAILPISYLALKMGATPEIVMYISLILSIIAQISRILIWRSLIEFKISHYLREVIFPTLFVSIVSFVITKIIVLQISVENNYLYILYVVMISLLVNCPLIYMYGLSPVEKDLIMNMRKKYLKN